MMINKLSHFHLREMIIANYNTKGKAIPNYNTFWETIIPKNNTIREKQSLITADDTGQTQ